VSTYYLLGNTVTFIDEQRIPKNRPIIFVANHQSLYDIPVMIYFLRKYHAKFVSKIELAKGIPSISYNLRHGGAANIDRNDPRQSITEIARLGTDMKQKGWSAMIFPEGTRSKDGVVRTFQAAGVATLVKRCPEALIVPVAISNSWKMVRYGKFPLNTFISMKWQMLPSVEPEKGKVDEAVLKAETAIKAALGQV
jgi:1-acyl-sn-glycerol-3-phosphate acyltransferase